MATDKLQETKKLIKKDRLKAKNPKKVKYSKVAKEKISDLIKIIPIKKLSVELGVSKSFLVKLKKSTRTLVKNEKLSSPLQFVEIPNSLMKCDSQKILPIMRFSTAKGLTIEIFE
jgi:hypothetical protein